MKLAVLDLETDPFEHGQEVNPFVAGFYDGTIMKLHWSADCVRDQVDWLQKQKEDYIVYAHNGGRFDFYFYLPHFGQSSKIINGRIVQAFCGRHEFRDSFAIMPFSLATYKKDEIDYQKFKKRVREKHKAEICSYLESDLRYLHELVVAFHKEFGPKLTIGSAAMTQIKARHKFSQGNEAYDVKFRSDFYFGGRNQVFRSGIVSGDIRIYDVNSMYPYAMSSFLHPFGTGHEVSRVVERNTFFVIATGHNYGAFPVRQRNKSLDFTISQGTFATTIHEWNAALETGTFKPVKVIKTYGWKNVGCFDEFVSYFYNARMVAAKEGDEIKKLFYKFVLNSGYGKFAQNPNNYYDWYITPFGEFPPEWHECEKSCVEVCQKKWTPAFLHQEAYMVWQRPLQIKHWYNIAIGASITGAARAHLLRGLHGSQNPLYCDTDSIISVGDSNVMVGDTQLGAWKCEGTGTLAAICGKKLYAIFDHDIEKIKRQREKEKKGPPEIFATPSGNVALVKKAHKGAKLTGQEIWKIAQGETIEVANEVPAFKFDGSQTFTKRKIRRTGVV